MMNNIFRIHAKPAKLAKVVTHGLCELRVNSQNIIHNYLND